MENGVKNSDGVNESYGVNGSNGVNWSCGINESYGVNGSNGVNESNGVNRSYGVNWSNGVNRSYGVNWSYGVNGSYGILNCFGIDREIFNANKKRSFKIFGKIVSEDRFDCVWDELHKKLNGWKPSFNNAFELYVQSGEDWKKVNASEITGIKEEDNPKSAWKDMPKDAIEYVRSLPEYDNDIFEAVTGIEENNKKTELLRKADEFIAKAEELKKHAEELKKQAEEI